MWRRNKKPIIKQQQQRNNKQTVSDMMTTKIPGNPKQIWLKTDTKKIWTNTTKPRKRKSRKRNQWFCRSSVRNQPNNKSRSVAPPHRLTVKSLTWPKYDRRTRPPVDPLVVLIRHPHLDLKRNQNPRNQKQTSWIWKRESEHEWQGACGKQIKDSETKKC